MTTHDEFRLERDNQVARQALARYGYSEDTTLSVVALSENATYLVGDTPGEQRILRVHREGYHDAAAIASELAWTTALRRDGVVPTPAGVPTLDGDDVLTLDSGGRIRHTVLFEHIDGVEADEEVPHSDSFVTLGEMTARLHAHADKWRRPAGFVRFSWDWVNTLGRRSRWGPWLRGPGISPHEADLFELASHLIQYKLEDYGHSPDVFGLIHADLRLANVLVGGSVMHVIDFDDCGYGWFMYDLATALSFIEHEPEAPGLVEAWIEGYTSVTPLNEADRAIIPTMIMLRRLMLIAWMGSHSTAKEVLAMGESFTRQSVPLARQFVASAGTQVLTEMKE